MDESAGSLGMWEAMRELWRFGLLTVHGVPEQYHQTESHLTPSDVPYQDATEAFAQRVGFVRRTLYGDSKHTSNPPLAAL